MKKRVNILLLALLLVMVGCSNDAEDVADSTTLEDGTYLSTQTGHNGPVEFEVVIADSEISAINLGEHFETIGISTKAIETDLPEAIIEINR